jgi:UDP-N-acetyl-L-fucosamine synthase
MNIRLHAVSELKELDLVISEFEGDRNRRIPDEYLITDTSWRVLKLITGNARLSNKWGISE